MKSSLKPNQKTLPKKGVVEPQKKTTKKSLVTTESTKKEPVATHLKETWEEEKVLVTEMLISEPPVFVDHKLEGKTLPSSFDSFIFQLWTNNRLLQARRNDKE
jgi:hypothetical protein